MKTLIILILLGIILGLAYITRPSQRSFQAILTQQLEDRAATASASSSLLPKHADPDSVMKEITFKDRYLWVDIQHNGQLVYTGAFGHWFQWGTITQAPADPTPIKLPV